jgi:TolB-like protein/class 3 adenylate cyclase/tetratricopeptide (TPR) repeat protein
VTNIRLDRRLAAILAADVAGYGSLIGSDEEGTIASLQAHRAELFEPKITLHRGRLVKTTGDGLLVEFPSVVDALRCAVEVQREMNKRNEGVPAHKRIAFRIGIHVGDIVAEQDDIFGDGVNIAARLEALAEPGGISVSARVQEDAEGRLDVAFVDDGEQRLKNILRPVRVYRIRLDGRAEAAPAVPAAVAVAPPASTEVASIVVLPFQNLSADPEQAFIADGIVDDIIIALTRQRSLFVISRNSSFTYKGRAFDVKQIGRELSVRYVLEGSVRKAGNRIRISGQLVDAATGGHLWADRFEGDLEDIFELQDRVSSSVVGALMPQVLQAEIKRASHRPTESLDAHLLVMRGFQRLYTFTRKGVDEAREFALQAIALDPDYGSPYALALTCCTMRKAAGWVDDPEAERAMTRSLADKAVAVGRDDFFALSSAGTALAMVLGELEAGAVLIDQALAIYPNGAMVRTQAGFVRAWLGEPEIAIHHLQRAMQLSPVDATMFQMQNGMGLAHFIAGRDAEALLWSEKALQRNPFVTPAVRIAAASAAMLGRAIDATKYIAMLAQLDPSLRVSNLHQRVPLHRPQDLARLAEGLRRAGLAE